MISSLDDNIYSSCYCYSYNELKLNDLNDDKCQIIKLEYSVIKNGFFSFGFFPNGDLIMLRRIADWNIIYLYSFKKKLTEKDTYWKCSQKYDVEYPRMEYSKKNIDYKYEHLVSDEKLFITNRIDSLTQLNLSDNDFRYAILL